MTTTDQTNLIPAAARERILGHMNEDHADSVLAYAKHFAGRASATAATLAGLDQNGMDIVVTEPAGDASVRVEFKTPLADAAEAHHVLVAMSKEATAALRASAPSAAPDAKASAALERARAAAAYLRDHAKTALLATADADGQPDSSVIPFVVADDGALHTYISNLSIHTANLRANPRASVLLIEDEAAANHLLARRRLTLRCAAAFVGREEPGFAAPMRALREKFGPVMDHLVSMHDFNLVRLVPDRARLVAGFGQAYDAAPTDWTRLSHVNDTGHASAHAPKKS
jgi:putative heme iron utilization protein